MAKKGGAKSTTGYDCCALSPEQKAKVQSLFDTYPEASRDHITIVLRYYDFDQDKATDALTADGGSTALSNWQTRENSQTKVANKNKKKNKKKNRKDNGSIIGTAAPGTDGDAEDSSSLHSSNIDFDGEKEHGAKPELEMNEKVKDILGMCNNSSENSSERQAFAERECNAAGDRVETPEESKSDDGLTPSLDVDSIENSAAENIERLSPKEIIEEHSRHHSSKHPYNRQRHGSYRHSKSSSISEDNSASIVQTSSVMKNRSYVKSQKDLNRQSVSLQNILLKVENKLEEASKRMKNTFTELRGMLDKRQIEMELDLENVKREALTLLTSRLTLADELKARVERASTAPDSEWLDLRADIKQFVTERKYDDELGKTIWFEWSMDSIVEEIEKFGKVVPVKNNYSERNSVSRNQSSPELSQHDIDSKTDDGLPQDQADHGSSTRESRQDDGEVKMEKETTVKMGQGESRSRVFSNQKYRQAYRPFPNHNNQGRGRYFRGRGNTGGGFRGGRFDNNYSYRQYGGNDMRHDYRPQHQQQYSQDKPDYYHGGSMDEKAPEASHTNNSNNAPPVYTPNPPRDQQQYHHYARNQNRRPHRYPGQNHQGPHRGLHKPPRAHSETIASGGDGLGNSSNYEEASQEKKDMINGY